MILTTDALVGGTLSLALISATLPLTMNAAKKAADVRRDLVAEQVAISCNTALVTESDLTSADLSPGMTGSVKVKGSCGTRGSVDLIWKSGQERTISYNRRAERYIVK